MELPLTTLIDRMRKPPLGYTPSDDVCIRGIRLLDSDTGMLEGKLLYVAEELVSDIVCPSDSAVIYTCNPADTTHCSFFLPGYKATDIINELLALWEYFENCNEDLVQIVYGERNLQKFIEYCYKILGNPPYIVDSSFKVLAIIDEPLFKEISAIWKNLVEFGYLSFDIVAQLRLSRDLERMESHDRAALSHFAPFNNDFINYNLYYKDEVMGHFFVVGYNKKITKGDVAYVNHLGKLFLPAMQLDKDYVASRGRDYENFFKHVLSGTLKDSIQIEAQLKPLKWDYKGRYLLFAMQSQQTDHLLISSLCSRLESIRSCKPLFYENNIVAVIPIHEQSNIESIEQILEQLLREDGGLGGLSDEFDGFYRLPVHYRQAVAAIELGKKRPGVLEKYRDHALDHLLKNAHENMDIAMTCEKAVFRLRDYDTQHGSDFAHTLEIYLKNERSLVKTAKELHIHRNTLMYRISKIDELLALDLDNAAVRQRIVFSFWALNYLDREAER